MNLSEKAPSGLRIALFAGSFNPFTIGHDDIVRRALALCDRMIVAVGVNAEKERDSETTLRRVNEIKNLYLHEISSGRIDVMSYTGELTVDLAARVGATILIRGVRSVKDFEYERDMAEINRSISGLDTILLIADPRYAAISSSVVRELASYGHDITSFLPTPRN